MRLIEKEKTNSIVTYLMNQGKTKEKAKSILLDAEKIAEEELGKDKDDFLPKDWAYVMGIAKRMAKVKESYTKQNSLADSFLESDKSPDEFIDEIVSSGAITSTLGRAIVKKKKKKKV